MRIISGEFRGRRLKTPSGIVTRPTSDRVREALFSILGDAVYGGHVLDLFAGTGALGLEALSRGAASAVFVDQSKEALKIIEDNIMTLGLKDRTKAITSTANNVIQKGMLLPPKNRVKNDVSKMLCFDLIFLDPPYVAQILAESMGMIEVAQLTHAGTQVVCEHPKKDSPPTCPQNWHLDKTRVYGDTAISFYNCYPNLNTIT